MSVTGESPQPVEELTTANFGEVLLFGYAGYMRQCAEDNQVAEQLEVAARHLEGQALESLDGIPATQRVPEELVKQQSIVGPATGAVGLHNLAARARHRHGSQFIDVRLAYSHLAGREVTVTRLEGRYGHMQRNARVYDTRESVTGEVSKLHLGMNSELELYGSFFRKPWKIRDLVDPNDLQANVRLDFHE